MEPFDQIFTALKNIGDNFGLLGLGLLQLVGHFALWIIWIAWWLFAVDWRKNWSVLARGGWAPVVLLGITTALVWSRILPSDCPSCGLANFWWQLGYVGMLFGVAFLCGWLQGVFGWAPPEINFEPVHGHIREHDDHGHGHLPEVTEPVHVADHPHKGHGNP
jgi:hypothetical protein